MGPVELLIFQATPFCNIDCSYCYLPARNNPARIRDSVIIKTAERILREGLLGKNLEVLWHAGEPLVVPRHDYKNFFSILDSILGHATRLSYSFQTNGTLLSNEWCDFFTEHSCRVGVSIDGPSDIHDLYRRDRSGRGTHQRVVRGIEILKQHQIPIYAICVLHKESLRRPDDLFSFFTDLGIDEVCFNVEEVEGVNSCSSLSYRESNTEAEAFFLRYFELLETTPRSHWLREYAHTIRRMFAPRTVNPMVAAFEMLTVDYDGNYATFSPELLGMLLPDGERFLLGNVLDDAISFEDALNLKSEWTTAIRNGVDACKQTCSYFDLCGGGSPSNKLAENNSFGSSETLYCRLGLQAPVNAMSKHLRNRLIITTSDSTGLGSDASDSPPGS